MRFCLCYSDEGEDDDGENEDDSRSATAESGDDQMRNVMPLE